MADPGLVLRNQRLVSLRTSGDVAAEIGRNRRTGRQRQLHTLRQNRVEQEGSGNGGKRGGGHGGSLGLQGGIPVGSHLEYADDATLLRALEGRQEL